jgi:hypothetical protein
MRTILDPRQPRLTDPFRGLFSATAQRLLAAGWQGVFRHVILEILPVPQLAQHFDPVLGAPSKELYSMAGLVFLADFHGWTATQAAEAYIFRTDVQYALNLEPGVDVSPRTVERYQKLFRQDEMAATVFRDVTARLAQRLELNAARQRLDSTHVFSHMAIFGRTKLMAVAIQRFLAQVRRHAPAGYAALPEALRRRYRPPPARLFADAKDAAARRRSRQQAAEDLGWILAHFADRPELTGRPSYQALVRIFQEQCEVVADKVTVRAKPGGDCLQNPSDPEASYDGHKGPGYQVQIAETCGPDNEVQLITAALPQTAYAADGPALVPMLEQLKEAKRLPAELLVDAAFAGDENVQAAEARGVELIGPIPGRAPEGRREALSIDDFAVDERTGVLEVCPAGHPPQSVAYDAAAGTTTVEMPATACAGCPFRDRCPIEPRRDGRFVLEFTDKDRRLAGRRREQETDVFRERYAKRSGIESTNSGLKNRLGLKRLRVRGRDSVFRVIHHKLAGWNVLRAAASTALRAWVAERVARALGACEAAQPGQCLGPLAGRLDPRGAVFRRVGLRTLHLRLNDAA